MNLDRALQLNTAALVVVGALFLGLGHDSVVLPLALCLAAVVSVSLGLRFPWLRLNRLIANLIALGAVLWTLRHFLEIGSERQLLAIADMLVYLQIILLFQEKSARVYWQLLVLSLLQVVVAAALSLGPQFGLLLAAYMALALSALILLCYFRESRPSVASTAAARPMVKNAWDELLREPLVSAAPRAGGAMAQARRGPLSRQVTWLALATIMFAAAFFYGTPRLREGAWADLRGRPNSSTGFTAEVAIEESGRIHQSSQLVMRVTLTARTSGEPYLMLSEPYFHGMALTEYVHDRGGGDGLLAARCEFRRCSKAVRGCSRRRSCSIRCARTSCSKADRCRSSPFCPSTACRIRRWTSPSGRSPAACFAHRSTRKPCSGGSSAMPSAQRVCAMAANSGRFPIAIRL